MPVGKASVTHAGRGIGAGITRPLAGDAWEVVAGARSREQVETVADDIDGRWVHFDVSDPGSVERGVTEAGEVDLLVANAGIDQPHTPVRLQAVAESAGGAPSVLGLVMVPDCGRLPPIAS